MNVVNVVNVGKSKIHKIHKIHTLHSVYLVNVAFNWLAAPLYAGYGVYRIEIVSMGINMNILNILDKMRMLNILNTLEVRYSRYSRSKILMVGRLSILPVAGSGKGKTSTYCNSLCGVPILSIHANYEVSSRFERENDGPGAVFELINGY